ncbi:hypothetical protein RvY_13526-1 [Ramazzottius varieornatus]|uniref:Uncharacterized protein n=1 Tax=Ramazzottius varieornatus TaxID=947166 RepID=A0A1D1VS80_RAMVA|nr:hypothetical protein RvY_13526-1 [Ramazzottius varieornatus]
MGFFMQGVMGSGAAKTQSESSIFSVRFRRSGWPAELFTYQKPSLGNHNRLHNDDEWKLLQHVSPIVLLADDETGYFWLAGRQTASAVLQSKQPSSRCLDQFSPAGCGSHEEASNVIRTSEHSTAPLHAEFPLSLHRKIRKCRLYVQTSHVFYSYVRNPTLAAPKLLYCTWFLHVRGRLHNYVRVRFTL